MNYTHITVPITSLSQHPHNPRIHGKENINYIKKSLKTFSQYSPIIVDKDTQHILAGNGTFQAALELWFTEIDTIQIEGLTEEQKLTIIIADNKLNESSYWIKDSLKEINCPYEFLNPDFSNLLNKFFPEKKEKYSFLDLFWDLYKIIISSLVAAFVVYCLFVLFQYKISLFVFVIQLISMGSVYFLLMFLFREAALFEFKDILLKLLKK